MRDGDGQYDVDPLRQRLMYPPKIYLDKDSAYTSRIMNAHSFAVLTCAGEGAPLVTHLPLLEQEGKLYGHVARENPMVDAFDNHTVFKAVFSGPHAYISASLYDRPEKSVPTWDYTAVHISGTATSLDTAASDAQMMHLAKIFEPTSAWTVDRARDYVIALMPHIVAFEMNIDSVQGFRKLSTAKNIKTKGRITDALTANGEDALAQEILRRQKEMK